MPVLDRAAQRNRGGVAGRVIDNEDFKPGAFSKLVKDDGELRKVVEAGMYGVSHSRSRAAENTMLNLLRDMLPDIYPGWRTPLRM